MFVALLFMFIGLFFVIAFLAAAISVIMHWDHPAERAEKIGLLLKLIPGLFWGIGSFCFTFQMLMWNYGALSPTGSKTFAVARHGSTHYVNGPLYHWMLGITGVCLAGLIVSVIIWKARSKAAKAAAATNPADKRDLDY
ncbi:MAG: hypothetical protein ABFD69_10110 [Candidatus Sumerlaeia bacterium]